MKKRRKRIIRAAVDTETTGLNSWTGDRPFAVSYADDTGSELYWEWTVDPKTRKPIVPPDDVADLNDLFSREDLVKTFWNAKFDYLMLRSIGVDVRLFASDGRRLFDEVSFMARAVNNLEFAYKLKPLAKKYLDHPDDDEKALRDAVIHARKVAKKLDWNRGEEVEQDYWIPRTMHDLAPREAQTAKIPKDVCRQYAMGDVRRTLGLDELYRFGMRDYGVTETYEREMALWPTTMQMEVVGITVDPKRLRRLARQCKAKANAAMAQLKEASGNPEFNPNSSKQLIRFMFEGHPLSLPVLGKTKNGAPKTDAENLVPHKHNPLVAKLFEYRANRKAADDFFGKYRKLATVEEDGTMVLHPGYNQWGTLTGRYSCSEPNLQQVSSPDSSNSRAAEWLVDIRQVFVPRKGHVWFCPDYSQVEVILFAAIYGVETMLDAIRRGEDIHAATANKIWGGKDNEKAVAATLNVLRLANARGRGEKMALELLDEHGWQITEVEGKFGIKAYRKLAKSATFTKIFGGGPNALMGWIDVSHSEASQILDDYDTAFPDMVEKMREVEQRGKRDGFVMNPFGRRLSVDPWYAYRIINHVVQSSAADLIKLGMTKVARYLKSIGVGRVAMTIHDELILEFLRQEAYRKVIRECCRLMSDHEGRFCVPTPVDVDRVDERWSKKQKVAA